MSRFRQEIIGDATLILGDCREAVEGLDPPGALVTDPPYGMTYQSWRTGPGSRHRPIAGDRTDELLQWACRLPALHSKYIFCRWDNVFAVPKPASLVTWVKNNWSMGDLDHEH